MVRRIAVAGLVLAASSAMAQQIEAEEFRLDNGMRFILVPRDDQPLNVAAGWLAKVGSVNEPAGMSGVTHFLEHMMFKGTDAIGTTDAPRDRDFRQRLGDLRQELFAAIYETQYPRLRAGEIDDPWDPANDTPEIRAIRAKLTALQDEQKTVTLNNDFDRIYTSQGASGMNAQTFYDWTRYFITIPSNKLELWAWLESDRLGEPSLREFDAEKDVVVEERRQRYDAVPTGYLDEQFESMFWMASGYNWPVIGWPSDLQSYTEEATRQYYQTYYQPRNLVGVIVGDFDPAAAKAMVTEYFGRLEDPGRPIPPVTTIDLPRLGEFTFKGECDCQPKAMIAFQSVPYGHADEPALSVLADLLNGRTGRLYKSMIEGSGIASSAQAAQFSLKHGGAFVLEAEVKGAAAPAQLAEALRAEVQRLQTEPVPDRELQKVKNQTRADAVRGLEDNMGMLQEILMTEAYGSWEDINEYPDKIDAVTAEDVMRVAKQYLSAGSGTAIYTRRAGGGDAPRLTLEAALASVPEAMRGPMGEQVRAELANVADAGPEDLDDLKMSLEQLDAQEAMVPEPMKPLIAYVRQEVTAKIAQLEGGAADPGSDAGDDQGGDQGQGGQSDDPGQG